MLITAAADDIFWWYFLRKSDGISCEFAWNVILFSQKNNIKKELGASLSDSVGCASYWWSGGCWFIPHEVRQQATFFHGNWSWNILNDILSLLLIILPTYEVCGGIIYTPDIRSMFIPTTYEVCGGIMFSLFRSFVCTFVRSFIFPSQGQSFCVKVYKTSYFEGPLMDFIHIWHDGRYRSKVFISTFPTPGVTLESRSRT